MMEDDRGALKKLSTLPNIQFWFHRLKFPMHKKVVYIFVTYKHVMSLVVIQQTKHEQVILLFFKDF